MSNAYLKGIEIANLGYSIHYNPYRHKGTGQEYQDFIDGYISAQNER